MPHIRSQLEKLQKLNMDLRQRLEQAELTIPQLNEQIEHLVRIGLVHENVYLGDIVMDQTHSDSSDMSTVKQAALLVPGGFGILHWDRECLR